MMFKHSYLSRFYVSGISYRKADIALRGQFALTAENYAALLQHCKASGIHECFVISTCNRTEIYGVAEDPQQLTDLLCKFVTGDELVFQSMSYSKQGGAAIGHLFDVAAGLDSQILGDYEILGQLRQAVKVARHYQMIGTFMNRLLNTVFQSSKKIKTETVLSKGTVSVSYAAVMYLKKNVQDIHEKNIVLIGTGKFGRLTCKHLVEHLRTRHITLVNRTEEKAQKLAHEHGLNSVPLSRMAEAIADADVILVATNSPDPIIRKYHLTGHGTKLIIDLSIPYNVSKDAQHLKNVTLVNVDLLSQIRDSTLLMREAEVPKARAIVATHIQDFLSWARMRQYMPLLRAVKSTLKELHHSQAESIRIRSAQQDVEEDIQRVISRMAAKMKVQMRPGCHYIEAINDFIS